MQVSYNVPDLEAEDCSFDFTVSAKFGDKKSKDLLIKACAKYVYQYIIAKQILKHVFLDIRADLELACLSWK